MNHSRHVAAAASGLRACAVFLLSGGLSSASVMAGEPEPCDRILVDGFESTPSPAPVCQRIPMNDSGAQHCATLPPLVQIVDECTGDEPAGQDAFFGRDRLAALGLLDKAGEGHAGFDFSTGVGGGDAPCVVDNVTGLLWESKFSGPTHPQHGAHRYTWFDPASADGNPGSEGATNTCNNSLGGLNCNTANYVDAMNAMSLCGFSDWRLPTMHELAGLTDYGLNSPALDTLIFPNTEPNISSFYWTSSPRAAFPAQSWVVASAYGVVQGRPKTDALHVRLVRGGPPVGAPVTADHCLGALPARNPDSAYEVHGDGTVTDLRTGLMWKHCEEGRVFEGGTCVGSMLGGNWFVALNHADGHVFAGHDDWRLPSVRELHTLVDDCAHQPAQNTNIFPLMPGASAGSNWTATPLFENGPAGAWIVQLHGEGVVTTGATEFINQTFRLVRGAGDEAAVPED